MGESALEMSLVAKPNQSGMPTPHISTWRKTLQAPHGYSPRLVWEKERGTLSSAITGFLSMEDNLSVGHMYPLSAMWSEASLCGGGLWLTSCERNGWINLFNSRVRISKPTWLQL